MDHAGLSTIDLSTAEQRRMAQEQAEYEANVAAGAIPVPTFAGLPVTQVELDDITGPELLVSVPPSGDWARRREVTNLDEAPAWRVCADGYEEFAELWELFLAAAGATRVRALVIGTWGDEYENAAPLAELVAAAETLPELTALYIGDIDPDRCEISWIRHDDITPVLRAYPKLEVFKVRGSSGLRLEPVRHELLRALIFECGGLPGGVVRGVGASDLPALEHLELWLGTDRYGGDYSIDDLAPVLSGSRLPRLTSLALRDAEDADLVAEALASAPVVARLHALDLSLGTLSDRGAEALLTGQPLTHLRKLDLRHHFLSEEMAARIVAELPGVDVDVSDRQEVTERGRFIAVSE